MKATNGITPAAAGTFTVNVPEAPSSPPTLHPPRPRSASLTPTRSWPQATLLPPTHSGQRRHGSRSTPALEQSRVRPRRRPPHSATRSRPQTAVTPPATAGPFSVTVYTLPATPTGVTATPGVTSATVTGASRPPAGRRPPSPSTRRRRSPRWRLRAQPPRPRCRA